MKVGDFVRWDGRDDRTGAPPDTGIVVDGPRLGTQGNESATRYAVAWLDAKETFWHNEYNLELLSENW